MSDSYAQGLLQEGRKVGFAKGALGVLRTITYERGLELAERYKLEAEALKEDNPRRAAYLLDWATRTHEEAMNA